MKPIQNLLPLLKNNAWLIAFALLLITCKKEETSYILEGRAFMGSTNSPLADASVEVQKQVVTSGVFGGSFSTAATGTTDANGAFSMTWPRENFAGLKLKASKSQYITREILLSVNDFSGNNAVTQNVELYPEAYIHVHIQNNGTANDTDQLHFTYTNAQFDCLCCANGWKTFDGAGIDTNLTCKLYGDTWLKYQKQVITMEGDTTINDSIFCPAFNTTNLEISY